VTTSPAIRAARVVCLVLLATGRASAQMPQDPPAAERTDEGEPAATAATPGIQRMRPTLALTLSLSGAGAAETGPASGAFAGFQNEGEASLAYASRGQRTALNVSAQSVVRYQPAGGALSTTHDQGTADFSMTGKRATFHVSQNFTYTPLFQYGALTETSAAAAPGGTLAETAQAHGDYANAGVGAYRSETSVDMARTLGRRSTLSVSYGLRHTTFTGAGAGFTAHAAGFRLTRQFTRHAALRAGYSYQLGGGPQVVGGVPARAHDIDLGIDYGRALSFSKRTSVSFASGSAIVTEQLRTVYRVTGDVSLTRAIGRTASAGLTYRRGVRILEGFGTPVMFDAVNAGFSGSLARRLTLVASAGVSSGVTAATSSGGFGTVTGAAALRMTLSRRTALEAQYFYFHQRADGAVGLPPGFMGTTNRQGVRVGVSWGTSLLH
jgi:hypothetical protein